MKINIVCTWH